MPPRPVDLIVDGSIYGTWHKLLNRAGIPAAGTQMDYMAIHNFAERAFGPALRVDAHWVGQGEDGDQGHKFRDFLRRQGFSVRQHPHGSGNSFREDILVLLTSLKNTDSDVLFVGGDSYQGRFTEVLREISERGREVGIASFRGENELTYRGFRQIDLVDDIKVTDLSVYQGGPDTSSSTAVAARDQARSVSRSGRAGAPTELVMRPAELMRALSVVARAFAHKIEQDDEDKIVALTSEVQRRETEIIHTTVRKEITIDEFGQPQVEETNTKTEREKLPERGRGLFR